MYTLIGGRLISGLGSGIFSFALSLHVLDVSGSAFLFSVVLGFALIPGVLVNLFAGALVDKWNKKSIIIATDVLSALCIFLMLPLWTQFQESIPFIVLYSAFLSMIQALNNLAVLSIIPELVEEEKVNATNSILQVVNTLISFVGPMLGALCYAIFSMEFILILDAISFLAAGLLEITLKPIRVLAQAQSYGYWSEMKDGYQFLVKKPVLRLFIGLAIVINGLYMPLILLVIPFVSYEIMQVSSYQLSVIEAAWAIGGALGGIFIATQKNTIPYIQKLFYLLAIQAILILLWVLPEQLHFEHLKWAVCIFLSANLLIIGLLNVIQNVPLFSYIQLTIPDNLRGKVLGFVSVFMMVSTPVGMFLFGSFLQSFEWRYICLVSAIIILGLCVYANYSKTFLAFKMELSLSDKNQKHG
ncbi:MFS transporter [Luteibaculum oceani]|uniref:MFS transporter n=1 Tax=Luteibaculum oceani TaxID=1294296 RepID=A0A5C6V951_9FLAO|nr:MFS transporter [Luteibaculum oceani]TXC81943.1 MFS transporter [Luteibaculum oceani]